MGGRALKISQV